MTAPKGAVSDHRFTKSSCVCGHCAACGKAEALHDPSPRARLERLVEFEPAYHKIHDDPDKDYGVGGVRIRFVLRGPKGATQFLMGTDWHLPETWDWWTKTGRLASAKSIRNPNGWDLGYHAVKPQNEYEKHPRPCCYTKTGKCYYDGSGLRADAVLKALIKSGHEAVWKILEAEYRRLK